MRLSLPACVQTYYIKFSLYNIKKTWETSVQTLLSCFLFAHQSPTPATLLICFFHQTHFYYPYLSGSPSVPPNPENVPLCSSSICHRWTVVFHLWILAHSWDISFWCRLWIIRLGSLGFGSYRSSMCRELSKCILPKVKPYFTHRTWQITLPYNLTDANKIHF